MHPSVSTGDAPPAYDELKAHSSSLPEISSVQCGCQSDLPPPYVNERTLPRDLHFLPEVEVISSTCCGCSVIRGQPGSEHDGRQTTVLCDDCRPGEEQVADDSCGKCFAQVAGETTFVLKIFVMIH